MAKNLTTPPATLSPKCCCGAVVARQIVALKTAVRFRPTTLLMGCPTGPLDSGLQKLDSAGAPRVRPVGITSSKAERTPFTMSAAAPVAAAVMVKSLEDGRIQLSGGTYPIKDQIRAHGGRWNPVERVWTLPAGTDTAFLAVPVAPAAPVAAAPKLSASAEALYRAIYKDRTPPITKALADFLETQVLVAAATVAHAPRRRDGRCCDHATAFWPSTDPYAHYGPAHYRCPHHGETRGTYSGT